MIYIPPKIMSQLSPIYSTDAYSYFKIWNAPDIMNVIIYISVLVL